MSISLPETIALLQGIESNKKWQYSRNGTYEDPPENADPIAFLTRGWEMRLKPWTLPDPPAGRLWHRTDWTEEWLPEGWRPLLEGERPVDGDEFLVGATWREQDAAVGHGTPLLSATHLLHRTKRPLPAGPEKWAAEKAAFAEGKAIECRFKYSDEWHKLVRLDTPVWCESDRCEYRIKPPPEWISLEMEDFGTDLWWIRNGANQHYLVRRVALCGVLIDTGGCLPVPDELSYDQLRTWERCRPGQTEWEPCKKIRKEAA